MTKYIRLKPQSYVNNQVFFKIDIEKYLFSILPLDLYNKLRICVGIKDEIICEGNSWSIYLKFYNQSSIMCLNLSDYLKLKKVLDNFNEWFDS